MDEKPPEIESDLRYLAPNVRSEFIRLFKDCLITRSYGIEQRMDHGRTLLTLRTFMKDRIHAGFGFSFDKACEWLDYTTQEARERIARTLTWDIIREHLDSNGSNVGMPSMESHIDALLSLNMEDRGPAWVQFSSVARGNIPITASNIRAWAKNYHALPVESETVETADPEPGEIDFDDGDTEPEVSKEDVPRGAKQAIGAVVPPAQGKGPEFKHPEEVLEAIEKIALACGGDNSEVVEKWRVILSDPIKVDFQDILTWADNDKHDIKRIASLITGDMHKSLDTAMRIVKGVIDSRTTLNFLFNRCRAEGDRLEHVHGPYSIVITYHKERDYEA